MNDSLKKFMEQLRFRMNIIENSLQTEESGNKIAFMQGIVLDSVHYVRGFVKLDLAIFLTFQKVKILFLRLTKKTTAGALRRVNMKP